MSTASTPGNDTAVSTICAVARIWLCPRISEKLDPKSIVARVPDRLTLLIFETAVSELVSPRATSASVGPASRLCIRANRVEACCWERCTGTKTPSFASTRYIVAAGYAGDGETGGGEGSQSADGTSARGITLARC